MVDDGRLDRVLEHARRELLDLTTRNRLLHTPRTQTRSGRLEIVDELSEEAFHRLVMDGKALTFLARAEDESNADSDSEADDESSLRSQPLEESGPHLPEMAGAQNEDLEPESAHEGENLARTNHDPSRDRTLDLPPDFEGEAGEVESGAANNEAEPSGKRGARHRDDKLQTLLNSEQLQKRLLKLFYDARTFEEEQGVNILYLALGFLRWFEEGKSDRERFAPLLLIPVQLDRPSANSRFKLRFTGEDVTTNLSLQARLKSDFGVELPEVPEADELVPAEYFAAVQEAVKSQTSWDVLPNDMVLWFFSFSKFLMYRDLDPTSWPPDRHLQQHPLITSLLGGGFRSEPPLCSDEETIDGLIQPIDMVHVLDADSSQALVIEETKRGRNLVIQGPPGTGKSQTIANLIASAVMAGKTVLFVAEKMAALEVVQRRLAQVGLGDMTLELHSHKAHKRSVLHDLQQALQLGRPYVEDVSQHCAELTACRDELNQYLQHIHRPLAPAGLTMYGLLGELVRLRAAGTPLPDFTLDGALEWTPADWESRKALLTDLVERLSDIGPPQQHPWRGVQWEVALPSDIERFLRRLPPVLAQLARLKESHQRLAEQLGLEVEAELSGTSRLIRIIDRLLAVPPADRTQLSDPVWAQSRSRIQQLVAEGEKYATYRQQLEGVVVEAAWELELTEARLQLAAFGRSWFRFLNRSYRQAEALLRGIVLERPPRELSDRLELLDRLIAAQKVRREINQPASAELGQRAFGGYWNGDKSDWRALQDICSWEAECQNASLDADIPRLLSKASDLSNLRSTLPALRADLTKAAEEIQELFHTLRLDCSVAFDRADLLEVPYGELTDRMERWQSSSRQLVPWVTYHLRHRRLAELGLGELGERLQQGILPPNEAVARFEVVYYELLLREILSHHPELAQFHGGSHEQLRDKFRELDQARIAIARHEVAEAHFQRLPAAGAQVGAIGLVRREIQKKRRHLPLRKLLAEAGQAVQAIKPVFMMSPISVAQYLEPGGLEFDLLLIDEASQIQPVDALGGIARCHQIVVVGDSKQLPPTRFFSRLLEEDLADDHEETALQTGDMESILGLCCAQNVPQRMLAWHYRSRHHSLIAVSNREFYDEKLYVIPSPGQPRKGQGLLFQFVPDGTFDRGGSASNRREAQVVAEAVMRHARETPQQTLGVGTFSVSQRDAILDELELLRRADSACEEFFAGGTAEPFFVKNLENIQGDERDVIFISVGYGRTKEGNLAMNFGPLSNDGGERRLNVLITRARECCCVYSSIKGEDIDLNRAQARGAAALKTFLKYAESGLMDTGAPTRRDHDSEFERQVAQALAKRGYQIDPQVGVAGFFIDLAVRDPDMPESYLLGIECDGANYRRSRSARDRDRLRQAVLESRGWSLHRIWSTDWFYRPEDELRRVLDAIDLAKEKKGAHHERGMVKEEPVNSNELLEIPRHEEPADGESSLAPYGARPYEVASFRLPANRKLHQLRPHQLVQIIQKIVQVEGPIHREEIVRRVSQLYRLQRAGRRVREAVDVALQNAAGKRLLADDADFFALTDLETVPIRDRAEVPSSSLRKPEMLPPTEIRQALVAVVQVHFGMTREEAITETARLLGFRVTTAQLRQVLEQQLDWLLSHQLLMERGGKVGML